VFVVPRSRSPALLFLFAFTHYPALSTVVSSFFSTPRGRRPAKFVGLENYRTLIEDEVFWKVLLNNAWFALGTIPVSIGLALVMALWVNSKLRGFAPTVLPLIAVANIWLFFYTPGFGLVDQVRGGLFGLPAINLLGRQDTVLAAVIVVAIWKEAGFFMIFYLAALQSIPPVLREAADVEGASSWYYTRRILLPLLMPTTLFVSINAVINSFRLVDHIIVMTEGGPDNASSLLTVVMLLLLSLLAIGQFFLFDRKIHYR